MPLSTYGFLVRAPGYDPAHHHAVLKSPAFSTRIVGVSTVAEARREAFRMIESGVQVIELCGGFGPDEASQIIDAVEGRVPVGHVRFAPAEQVRRTALLDAAGVGKAPTSETDIPR